MFARKVHYLAMTDSAPNAFGRAMRFWRGVFGLSQEDLAEKLEVSLKHVSYLETGRSHPSEALVQRLGTLLGLGRRDLQFLSIAANHFTLPPQPLRPVLSDEEMQPLVATLKSFDPFPAYVTDPYGDIYLVNRAWAVIWRAGLGDVVDRDDANSYRFFFMNGGWREKTVNAEDVGSWLLMSIQQEVLLHVDPRAVRLLEEFQAQPYVPRDWARRAAMTRPSFYYQSINRPRRGAVRRYWVTTHSVGPYPMALNARLWINIVYPQDMTPDLTLEQIEARNPRHAMLPY
jgi:transcriptional regulator with XRE-family HTH domain